MGIWNGWDEKVKEERTERKELTKGNERQI